MTKEKLRKGDRYIVKSSNLCYSYMLAGDEVTYISYRANALGNNVCYFKPLIQRSINEEFQYLYEDALVHVVPSGRLAKALYGLP